MVDRGGWHWLDSDENIWPPIEEGVVAAGLEVAADAGGAEGAGSDDGLSLKGARQVPQIGDAGAEAQRPTSPVDYAQRLERCETGILWLMQVQMHLAAVGGYVLPPLPFHVPPFQPRQAEQQQEPVNDAVDMED
ncbi:hypothetical protein QVD17_24648 [Tagetes erecta]|uniref:Uncharacterized protein n=1 Tax=Tagetes erecta TaxID=13708 RepID=A0AAD8KIU8_TARER|nr:hypothetical protein QVD17_24648 [Tagetes erecta]